MSKYFIQINENEKGLYDFLIEFINEEAMDEIVSLGIRKDIESLGEVYDMIEDFPLSPLSELTLVTLNRYNKNLEPNKVEALFTMRMNSLVASGDKAIKAYELN